jgi:hypothetical protein
MPTLTRHRAPKGGVLKIILILVGLFVLGAIALIVGGGWYAKTKIDEAGGLQAFTGKLLGTGLELLKPEIEKSLGPEDRQRLNDALAQLKASAPTLSEDQLKGISDAMQKMSGSMQSGAIQEADARAFVDELVRLLESPPPATPSTP